MKNSRQLFIFVIIAIALTLACDNESENVIAPDPPISGEFVTVPVQVSLPTGTSLDITTSEISSLFENHAVSDSGSSEATYLVGGRSIASLVDSAGQVILFGFITDSKKELSVASTLEVLVYFGLGTAFLPDTIKEQYINEVSTWPGFNELVTQVEVLFESDQYFITSEVLKTLLQAFILEITQPGEIIGPQLARMQFSNDTRSGINLKEIEGDALTLVNSFRRRAHAFFYKVSSKNTNGVHTYHIRDIVGSNASFQHEMIVSPRSGFTSFIGTLQSAASGKGLEFAKKESDPTTLKLLDNESEAKYKVRVIGPAFIPSELTDQENDRLTNLYIETLCFDFALPVFLAFVGEDSFLKDFKASQWKPFLTAFTLTVGGMTSVSDALYDGDLVKASVEFENAMRDGARSAAFKDLYQQVIIIITSFRGGYSFEESLLILERSENFFNALAAVDVGLQAIDFYAIYDGYKSSITLEQWEVDLTRNKVSLDPKETLVIQGEEKVFKTTIHDSNLAGGESYEYRYSMKESYGELRSKSTSAVGDSITSSSNQIGYFVSNVLSLPDDATDTVFVEVFIDHGTTAPLTRVGIGKAS